MATAHSTAAHSSRAFTVCFRIGPDSMWRHLLVTAANEADAVHGARAQFPHGRDFATFDPAKHLPQPNPRQRPSRMRR
jgi:hypothetical protein